MTIANIYQDLQGAFTGGLMTYHRSNANIISEQTAGYL